MTEQQASRRTRILALAAILMSGVAPQARAQSAQADPAAVARAVETALNQAAGPAAQMQYLEKMRGALPPGVLQQWLTLHRRATSAYGQASAWMREANLFIDKAARYAEGSGLKEAIGTPPALAQVGALMQLPVAGNSLTPEAALVSAEAWQSRSERVETRPAAWLKSLE